MKRIHGGIGAGRPLGSIRRIEDQSLAPDEPGMGALLDDHRGEPTEDSQSQASTNLTQTGMIGQWLVEVIADLLHQLTFRANPGEEHQQLQSEEDLGIDGRPTTAGIAIGGDVPDKEQVEDIVEVAVEVILGHRGLDDDQDGTAEIAGLRRAEYGGRPFSVD